MNNIEIEIKVKVDKVDRLVQFLKENGQYQKSSVQVDEYYSPAHRSFVEVEPIKEWLRLRSDNGVYSLNYKNWQYGSDGKAYHCDEYEIAIDNQEKAAHILKSLDFKHLVTVHKERDIYMYQDYEVAFDLVKDLGSFVEVEFKGTATAEPKLIAEEMRKFIESTGAVILSQDFAGYPIALIRQKFN
jgi:predicted adenylyl cyclase CyaB